ncbi:TPM domain-containing protein [Enterococcus sp. CWB-B31]|uniref:TPM domain-containing protein n=1 Tax=Enterococcus sp. CWB-B31 TaxID=2885159 RepID=UPI001E6232D6|nr:TPM domain-containing protein [Enterococcus sp. CWB-B31]MCB5955309.1 TPM domain-containing protein [Enterococcus sp. CWB-B31]
MRKHFILFIALIGSLFLLPSFALAGNNTVDDQAGLLTAEQIQQLNKAAEEIETKAKASVFIVTNTTNTDDSTRFADLYMMDRIGKNENGITFYIDMNNRKFIISTSGNMIDYMTDSRIENTLDDIEPYMIDGNYFQAAQSFLKNVSRYVDAGVPKGHYRIDSETGKITYYKTLTITEIIIAVAAALVITGIFVGIAVSRYRLKFDSYNYPYREKSALQLTSKEDRLTNSFVTQRRIPKSNGGSGGSSGGGSTTHSTGGGTFGGGGRSF